MIDTIVEYLLFIGIYLYFFNSILFSYLFARTLWTKDGIGLLFLRSITLGIAIGSSVIFSIRILSEYGGMPFLTARAIAVINPIILLAVGLYLNFLFHQKYPRNKGL